MAHCSLHRAEITQLDVLRGARLFHELKILLFQAQAYREEGKYGILWDPALAAVDAVWAEFPETLIEELARE